MNLRIRGWKALAAVGAAATVASLLAPTAQALPPGQSGLNGTVDKIQAYGSDTTYEVMQDLDNAYNFSQGCSQTVPVAPTPNPSNLNDCLADGAQPANVIVTENYDHDVAMSYFPQGSSAGRRMLCESDGSGRPADFPVVDYIRSSSAPNAALTCAAGGENNTFRFVAFAKDALSWVTTPGAGYGDDIIGGTATRPGSPANADTLTQADLNQIFVTCENLDAAGNPTQPEIMTTWDELGFTGAGSDQRILPFGIQTSSGTASTWSSFVGGTHTNCVDTSFPNRLNVRENFDAFICSPPPADTEANARPGDIIIGFSVGLHNLNATCSIIGSVNDIAPTEGNIQNDSFPFTRRLYNVFRLDDAVAPFEDTPYRTPATNRYVGPNGWICKQPSQHTQPPDTAGPGIENILAVRDYAQEPLNVIRDNGFVPLVGDGVNVNRCEFTDVSDI